MKNAPSATVPPYQELCALARRSTALSSVAQLLSWDQETYMPPAAGAFRAEQSSLIAELHHKHATDKRVGDLIAACEQDKGLVANGAVAANLREFRRDYDRLTKLPSELVAELAKVGSQAQEVWKEAREKNDFALFAPWLEKMFALSRQKADCYGVPVGGERYDALLDEYEPGMTAKQIEAIFTPLRTRLTELVQRVAKVGRHPDVSMLRRPVPADKQHAFGLLVLKAMKFDLEAGRLDVTTHPFCSGLAPGDTRLTTRYRDEAFTDALYGTMHEAGHGLYEQGLPKDGVPQSLYGQPLAESISLGIHESQSRMWENLVGRSKEFWMWALPIAKKEYGAALDGVDLDTIYKAVNTVKPSLIRVEADEGTYNMHVMVRFEMERALLSGAMSVKDVPGEWNKRYKDYLGIDVPDDRRGCLQDVHWSFGLIGYFPTYTLGNLYAAQFWETIESEISDLRSQISKGEFGTLREWLRTRIHQHGKHYRADELCRKITGKDLSADALLRYLEGKVKDVYGV
ncbi:MAG: carboxypeptidase M32 [Phycisphaerae bacterium]|nr:carboxypeptidase M32 [Phycisphaerae bacterium]